MKITRKQLRKLIIEQMKYYRPARFDSRAEKEYPEYADKLTNLAGTGEEGLTQALEFSDALDDEPIDIGTEDQELYDWQKYDTRMGKSKEQNDMLKKPWQSAKKKFNAWVADHHTYKKSIWAIPKSERFEALQEFLDATGDRESYDVMKRTLEYIHMNIYLNNNETQWNKINK